jgi:hypothetical protein
MAAIGLAAQYAAHPLDHLALLSACGEHDPEIRFRNVDAFVEGSHRRDDLQRAGLEGLQDLASLIGADRTVMGCRLDAVAREHVHELVSTIGGLVEDERAVRVLDRGASLVELRDAAVA